MTSSSLLTLKLLLKQRKMKQTETPTNPNPSSLQSPREHLHGTNLLKGRVEMLLILLEGLVILLF